MFRALRHRNYRLFFSGQSLSLIGNWVTLTATMWLVWTLTKSPLMLGMVSFAMQIPAFLLSPIAGVLVDRWPRHRILMITQSIAMMESFALAALTLSGVVQVWHIMVLLTCQGIVNAFDMSARQAFVVEMVEDQDELGNAIALNSSLFNMARMVGSGIGGLLLALTSPGWCFLIDGISYVAVLVAFKMMKVPPFKRMDSGAHPWLQLREGFDYAMNSAPIRGMLLLIAGMCFVGMSYGTLMPVVAKKILHGGSGLYGAMMAVVAIGSLVGAITLARRPSVKGLGKLVPKFTMAFGIALVIFSHSNITILSMAALLVMGCAWMLQNASVNTIIQTIVDPDKRGRVMSFYVMAVMGAMPLGRLGAGALADSIGTQNTLLISGLGCLVIAFFFTRHLPRIGRHVRPIYQRLGIIPGGEG